MQGHALLTFVLGPAGDQLMTSLILHVFQYLLVDLDLTYTGKPYHDHKLKLLMINLRLLFTEVLHGEVAKFICP